MRKRVPAVSFVLAVLSCITFVAGAFAQSSADFKSASTWQASGSLAQLPDGGIPESSGNPGVIDPYFANLGALGWVRDSSKTPNVLKYIQWYVKHINPSGTPDVWGYTGGGTIYNYTYSNGQTGGCELVAGACTADSTDAYAGTFLTLLWAAWRTGDPATQQYLISNQNTIDQIGRVILATVGSNADGLSFATPTYQIKFLMDNCENWDGLDSLAQLFTAMGNSRASTYRNAANTMQSGILSMWMGNAWSYYRDGADHSSDHAPVWQYWYPDATAQMFPVAHHVVTPDDARARAAYQSLLSTSQWANWSSLPWNSCAACDRDNGNGTGPDGFPWVTFAYGMSLLQDSQLSTYMHNIESVYVNANPPYEPAPGQPGSSFWRTQENGPWMTLNSSPTTTGNSGQINGIDDTANTEWRGQAANGAYFGVANISEASQPYRYTTDGQSIRFDLGCPSGSSCKYGYAHIFNPSYGTSVTTDSATTITGDLLAEMDSVGVSGSQALEFGVDQSLCTANCGTALAQYTRFRYAMQCDFKGSGVWRVWDAVSGWVPTSHSCVAFTPLVFVHFTFHYTRPDLGHVGYQDIVINGVTYPVNMTQVAQPLGTAVTHEFIPWVNLDGDNITVPYSMWVDQWSISYSGSMPPPPPPPPGLIPTPPSNAVHLANLDDDPISSTPTNPAIGTWGHCTTADCGKPPAQLSLTHTSNPSVDGDALDAFDSGNSFWGVLFYHKNGQQNFATHYEVEWQFRLDVPFTSTQAIEFDFPVSINQGFFYFGSECDNGGNWRIWNPNPTNHGWFSTGIACPNFAANQWHTVRWYGTRTDTDFTYVALEVDGQQFSINTTISKSPCCNGWSDEFVVQFQPDGNGTGTGYNMYVDRVNAWIW